MTAQQQFTKGAGGGVTNYMNLCLLCKINVSVLGSLWEELMSLTFMHVQDRLWLVQL